MTVLTNEMLERFSNRAAGYDRDNRCAAPAAAPVRQLRCLTALAINAPLLGRRGGRPLEGGPSLARSLESLLQHPSLSVIERPAQNEHFDFQCHLLAR